MRPNRWARRGSAAGFAALLLAGACSPTPAVMVAAVDTPSAHPVRDFDAGTTSTIPPTTAPAATVLAHVQPPRASRSVRPRPTPPATAPVVRSGDCGGWRDLIASFSWPVDQACKVAWCESHDDPNARNRHSTAAGLFQVLGGSLDPATNVAQAFSMWSSRGWQPWAASRSCWA